MTTDSVQRASLTFAQIVLVVGSFCTQRENDVLDVHPLRLVQFVLKLYAVAWSHVPASLAAVTDNVQFVDSNHAALLNVNVGHVESSSIVSVVSAVVFDSVSRNLIYTVLFQSHAGSVYHDVAVHDCRFHGLAVSQNATCTVHTPASVGHVILSVTAVVLVAAAPLFIVNDHHAGAVVSLLIIYVLEFVGPHQ